MAGWIRVRSLAYESRWKRGHVTSLMKILNRMGLSALPLGTRWRTGVVEERKFG